MGHVLYQMVRDGRSFSGHERNCCFLNLGQGKFADVSSVSGIDFPDDGRAVARCDWDLDGDTDLWIANRSGPQVRFLRNDFKTTNRFLTIRLEGKNCNRDAIGARIEVTLAGEKLIQTLRAGEGFLAQSSKWLHFGLGTAEEIGQVVVHWPGGEREVFTELKVNHRYRLVQHSGKATAWTPPARTNRTMPAEEASPAESTQRSRVVAAHPVPLPRLDYETFEGQTQWLDQTAERQPLLVNLWATWCSPCLVELKEFVEHEDELRKAGVDVIALSVDRLDSDKQGTTPSAAELLNRIEFKGKAGWATDALIEKIQFVQQHLFDLHQPLSVPTSLLIDASGNLVVLYRGPVSVDQLIADVAELPNITSSDVALPFAGRWRARRKPLDPIDIAWRLVDHGLLDESIDYITRNKTRIAKSPLVSGLFVQIGTGLLRRGDAKSAISYFHEAIQFNENAYEAQNNLAWVLSTHPDKTLRNSKEAIRHITTAVKARPENAFSLLDTLAAAYAEDGQFERAVEVAQRAVDFAKSENELGFAKRIESRLQLYKARRPFRDK